MNLTSMELSKDEAKEESCPDPNDGSRGPKYPYGLCINLDDASMKKLGLDGALPAVGEKLMLVGMVEVSSVSSYENQSSEERSIGLQITDMQLSPAAGPSTAERLYGGRSGQQKKQG